MLTTHRDCHKHLVATPFYPHTLLQVAGIRMRKRTHRAKDSAQSDGEGGATGTRHSCASLCSLSTTTLSTELPKITSTL